MARNTGSKHKLCRMFGEKLCEAAKCPAVRRPYKAGVHWQRRSRVSEYGQQLREKQKAKFIYGLLEAQFRRTYLRASKERGVTGTRLLQLLEMRLDNVVFRSGLASTRHQARQLVTHGFVQINGKKVDIPSYEVKPGDHLAVRETRLESKYWDEVKVRLTKYKSPEWLEVNAKELAAKILTLPTGEMLDTRINPQLIVEHYSR
ncbi:MAG: 30S ribosomal protein S4 [Candidatus Doudnabacteria bacterium RIFCSPHIGHO2_02_FULL_46_11]|uniref:Small ribosomal subunit protein uS4 n=1 Tax=Candidatus Doudnabacteria bacterium RIFCSPHIGHO2_02_FULL_46_11 TaxID=1817832 RepID=A0A1F5P8G0_9BACT|nr:MAG: 30S ribosomal protein S4 [Candidatus Doudnabacteria bacterium RIFCSPHIGHO2_02_FULL_46_11]